MGDFKGFGPPDAKELVRAVVGMRAIPGAKWDSGEHTLFVGGLPDDMTSLEMYHLFAPFGPIAPRGATAMLDKETGKCTGIGFINYMDEESSLKAIRALDHFPTSDDGKKLTVKKKGPPKNKGEGKGEGKSKGEGK